MPRKKADRTMAPGRLAHLYVEHEDGSVYSEVVELVCPSDPKRRARLDLGSCWELKLPGESTPVTGFDEIDRMVVLTPDEEALWRLDGTCQLPKPRRRR